MALTPSEIELLDELFHNHAARWRQDERHYRYVTLQQRIEQLGMAIPPSMRRFLVVANWPRVVVRSYVSRQQIRSMYLPGEAKADTTLGKIQDATNMHAQMRMYRRDKYTYGRAFLSVSSNPKNPELPFIRAESPRQMEALVDLREDMITAACRFNSAVGSLYANPTEARLVTDRYALHVAKDSRGKWVEVERKPHRLGVVPVVMELNERWTGSGEGESELTDIIPLTDSNARSLTNLQFAQEAHGIPRMWMSGVNKNDFIDPVTGEMIPMFEAYFDAIHMLSSKDAKVGQLSAAELKNFETAIEIYGTQASVVTGIPARYFGIKSVNPPAEGAIIADEIQLVRNVEDKNDAEAVVVGWAAGLAYRIATGDWVTGNRINVDYHDPATPTVSQREDALAKRRAANVLSREGYWDELGWSEARKEREREYFAAEESDPTMQLLGRQLALNANAS